MRNTTISREKQTQIIENRHLTLAQLCRLTGLSEYKVKKFCSEKGIEVKITRGINRNVE